MAEEMSQEPSSTSVPAAQEPVGAVPGESQQVQADTTAPASDVQPDAAPSDDQEIVDWNGNDVDSLPKPLQARARGMLRHFNKVTQEAAAVKRHAQAYNEIVNHPEFQEFIKWKEERLNSPQGTPTQPQELLTEDEFLAAQSDPQKFLSVQQKILMQQAQPVLQKLQAIEKELATYKQEKVREDARRQLDAFAAEHKDFWDINPVVMKAVLDEVVGKGKGSIEDAYNQAKSLEKQYLDKAHGTIKQQVEAKKKAVSAPPSKSMEPEVIYVADKKEATKVAYENAKLGKRVDVRVKR